MGGSRLDAFAKRIAARPERAHRALRSTETAPSELPIVGQTELDSGDGVSRRSLLRRAGIVGAAAASYLLPGWSPAFGACRSGLRRCNGRCVNLRTNENHCGRCNHKCKSTQYCSKGKCCKKGLTNCGGTCVNLRTSEQHCGACGHDCPAGKYCSKGKCCPEGTRNCGGTCVNVQVNEAHCGACGNACASGEICQSGSCVEIQCSTASDCPGEDTTCQTRTCINNVCGFSYAAAGLPCDDGQFCTGTSECDGSGTCQGISGACDDGIDCTVDSCDENAQTCTHTPNDSFCEDGNPCTTNICDPGQGGCVSANVPNGTPCGDGITCINGECNYVCTPSGPEVCNGIDDDCDGFIDDGDLCPAPNANTTCSGGSCVIVTCHSGWGNCNNEFSDGCETNLMNNNAHCGACNSPCPPLHTCSGGVCVV